MEVLKGAIFKASCISMFEGVPCARQVAGSILLYSAGGQLLLQGSDDWCKGSCTEHMYLPGCPSGQLVSLS